MQVLGGGPARPDAGDEAAVLLHVVGDLVRVEGDRDVEVGEEDDQQEVHRACRTAELLVDQVAVDPALRSPEVELLGQLADQLRDVEQRRGEDDRDDAGHVDLERDVGDVPPYIRRPTIRFAYCTGIRRCDCSTKTTSADDREPERDDQHEDEAAAVLQDRLALAGDPGRDRGEDQQRHAVADAAVGDELAQPHDDGGAGRHRDDHRAERDQVAVVQDRAAVQLWNSWPRPGQRDEAGRLQDAQADGQVAACTGSASPGRTGPPS